MESDADDFSVEIRRRGEGEIEVRIRGETYTLVVPLVSALHEVGVEFAGYDVPHPLVEEAVVYVRTREGDPIEAVKRALDLLRREYEELRESVEREVERTGV